MKALPASQRIGLGTYQLGPRTYEVCRAALDLGYRHLDTAALYRNEAAVSLAVSRSGVPREEIFVVSKILARDIRAPHRLLPAARECVDRLGLVNLLLLHAPVGDWCRAWAGLQEAASWPQVGAVGVSNFCVAHLQALGAPLPLWNQIEASPFLPRRRLSAWCRQQGIGLVAHSPLTKGLKLEHPILREIAGHHGATPSQVLVAWALAQGFVVIPRSSDPAHLAENLAAGDLRLTLEDLLRMDSLEDGFATHPKLLTRGPPHGSDR